MTTSQTKIKLTQIELKQNRAKPLEIKANQAAHQNQNQTKPTSNQIKSNQTKPNQTKPKPNQSKSDQTNNQQTSQIKPQHYNQNQCKP